MVHKTFMLVFGMALVRLCTFNYFMNYGPPPRKNINVVGVPDNIVSGLGLTKTDNGLYALPNSNLYYSGENIYQRDGSGYKLGNTNYGVYDGDVAGFVRGEDNNGYSPSMAYIMARNANRQANQYQPVMNTSVYSPASGDLMSGLNPLLAQAPQYNAGSGAGRFMSGGLLGSPLNFSAPQTIGTTK